MDPKSELNDMMGNYMISNDAQSSFFKTPKNVFHAYNGASQSHFLDFLVIHIKNLVAN